MFICQKSIYQLHSWLVINVQCQIFHMSKSINIIPFNILGKYTDPDLNGIRKVKLNRNTNQYIRRDPLFWLLLEHFVLLLHISDFHSKLKIAAKTYLVDLIKGRTFKLDNPIKIHSECFICKQSIHINQIIVITFKKFDFFSK